MFFSFSSPAEIIMVKNYKEKCFEVHDRKRIACKKESCKHWINCRQDLNCVLISAKEGPKTLQEVGDVFKLTRMRICQIEKGILSKLKSILPS